MRVIDLMPFFKKWIRNYYKLHGE